MTSLVTWDPVNSRVVLQATGLGAATTTTWSYILPGRPAAPIRGGTVAVSAGVAIDVYDHEFPAQGGLTGYFDSATGVGGAQYIATPTVLDTCWLKFPGYPFLNTRVYPVAVGSVSRAGRSQVHYSVGTAASYQVQELMSGRSYELTIRTTTAAEYDALDAAFATGSPMLIHARAEQLHAPSMYCVVRDVKTERRIRGATTVRYIALTVEEISRPGADYFGSIGTWNSVPVQYATWSVLSTGPATWFDLVEIQGGAGDVIIS